MISIIGVAEIVLNARDLPKMRDFYIKVLGFKLINEINLEDPPNPEGIPTISFLEILPADTPLGRNGHPVMLALIDPARHASARARFTTPEIATSTLNHLAFEIAPESYNHHLKTVESLNLNPMEVKFDSMQAKAIFFRDPEGNTLELICHHNR